MSRCFPFPPPGYNKKATFEDTDLLTKEKHKEKKHKKDKKDKEKRECSKEKKNKDKDRSKEKQSYKKDRKEKHKDKKDRDKDKDKSRTTDAKRIEGQLECNDGDKLGQNSLQNNEISDVKYVQDLARRVRDDNTATTSHIGQKNSVIDLRKGEFAERIVAGNIDNRLEEKEKANGRKEADKKVNGQRNHIAVRSFGNAIFPGFPSVDQKGFQGISQPVETNGTEKVVEEKEQNKHSESCNTDSKYKDRNQEKKGSSKNEYRSKEKKIEEKSKEVGETCKNQIKLKDNSIDVVDSSPKLKDSSSKLKLGSPKLKNNGRDFVNSCYTKAFDVLKPSSDRPTVEGNLHKRKELERNGIAHDNGIRPNKLHVLSSNQVLENGRKSEPCHGVVSFESKWLGEVHNHKVGMMANKMNGLMEVPKSIVNSSRPLSTKARLIENGEAYSKPPHPDFKYLNQILSIPKWEDISNDLDDQEWLFSNDWVGVHSDKPKPKQNSVDGKQVWAEALRIEAVDLTVLPYVIPF